MSTTITLAGTHVINNPSELLGVDDIRLETMTGHAKKDRSSLSRSRSHWLLRPDPAVTATNNDHHLNTTTSNIDHSLPSVERLPEPSEQESHFPAQVIDGGFAAWRLLFAAFAFEALLWGFPLSFGVFQSYYATLPQFSSSRYTSVVGTTASGIAYLGAPLMAPVIRRWSRYRAQMIWIGWPVCVAALVAGSFAESLGTLIVTQGVGYGVGFLVFYYPILTFVDELWVKRRGMAYGFLCSASGVSGAVMPVILQALLRRYGYKTTLRAVAVMLVVLTGPLIPLLKGRKGAAGSGESSGDGVRTDWSFLRKPLFWTYSVSNLLMGLGYFFPSLYLPSYAASVGLSAPMGALLLTVMSIAQVGGQFTFGYLSDRRTSLNALLLLSLVGAAAATLALWGMSRSLAPLIVYAVLYGFFGTGYTAMWARMVTAVSEEPSASQAMFGLFCAGKGIGNVLAGPISAGLLRPSDHVDGGYGDGTYKVVVIFTGVCLLASAGCLGIIPIRLKQR